MKFFGQIARRPGDDVLRKFVFKAGTFDIAYAELRKKGRPRLTWKAELHKHAIAIAGQSCLADVLITPAVWEARVAAYRSAL